MTSLELKHAHESVRFVPLRLSYLSLLLAFATLVLPACHQKQTVAVERLIPKTPESRAGLLTEIPRFTRWEQIFTDPGDSIVELEYRRLAILANEGAPTEGLRLSVTGALPSLVTRAKLQTSEIAYLDLQGSGLSDATRLFWTAGGKPFESKRSITGIVIQPGQTIRFFVEGHPQWTGVVSRLRIELKSKIGSIIVPGSIRAIDKIATQEFLGSLSENTYVVELDGTTVPARFLFPGKPLEWQFRARPGDQLRFSTGTPILPAGDSHLRITLETSEAGSATHYDLPLQAGSQESWVEHEIEVPVFSDPEVTVKFETEPDGSEEPSPDFTVLGNPTVLRGSTKRPYPNLILISIDTLRSDHVSSCGYPRTTTPMLDAFFEEKGTILANVVAGSPWTLPSHVTMLSGLDAVTHGANFDHIPDPTDVELLAETLRSNGYTSMALTGGGFLSSRYGFISGFDQYSSWPSVHRDGELKEHVGEAQSWILDHSDERFFVMLHTYEVHTPFRPREPYFSRYRGEKPGIDGYADSENLQPTSKSRYLSKKRFRIVEKESPRTATQADHELLIDLYDAGISFTDAVLGGFLKKLDENGVLANTIVVITSDHGESFGERGLFGHGNLHDSNLMVPLLIAGPGIRAGAGHIESQVGLVDLGPTLLDLMGIPQSNPVDGISLLPLLKGNTAGEPDIAWSYAPKTNYGIAARRGNKEKLTFNNTAWPSAFGHTEVFDLLNDPNELNDLGGHTNPDLRSLAETILESSPHGLELKVLNQTERRFKAVFGFESSDKLLIYKVKGTEIPKNGLKKGPGRGFTVILEGGESIDLVLESIATRELTIVGSGPSAMENSLDHAIDLPGMANPSILYFDGSQWQQSNQSPPDSNLSVRLTWRSAPTTMDPAQGVNETLRSQLEALGYVE